MAANSISPVSTSDGPAPQRRVLLANPRGFCAGVQRAIDAVEQALERHGAPVYVRRAIVHNRSVVEELERKGAVFVQEVDDIPQGAVAILSAHGSARSVRQSAQGRGLRVVDAICPLVAKVHAEIEAWYRGGRHVLLIGHIGHPEIVGTLGQVPHMGTAPVDWEQEGERYRKVVLDRVRDLLIPDLYEQLDTCFHYTPQDFHDDLGAHLGSAFSLEPILTQSAWFRGHNRDDHFPNLYFVGAGTHPGAGIPGVVGSAKATASLIV